MKRACSGILIRAESSFLPALKINLRHLAQQRFHPLNPRILPQGRKKRVAPEDQRVADLIFEGGFQIIEG
jgi:hypothetical protein